MHTLHRWLLLALVPLGVATCWAPAQAATLLEHSGASSSGELWNASPFSETPEANAPPEYGRCIKTRGGAYKDSACTKMGGPAQKRYEWFPAFGSAAPLEKAGFSNALQESTVATLETVGGAMVTCKAENTTGEYTGNRTVGNVIVTFSECTASGVSCTSEGAPTGTIVTSHLEGELGVEELGVGPLHNKIGQALFPTGHSGPFAQFSCSTFPLTVSGSIISPLTSNSMKLTTTVSFKQSKGKQQPEHFVGEAPDVLMTQIAGETPQQSGESLTADQTGEEKVEVNSVL